MQRDVQKLEIHAYFSFINNIIEVNDDQDDKPSKQNRFWSYIKSLRKDNTGITPLKDKGRLFNALKEKANILKRQYQFNFTQEDTNQVPSTSGTPYPDMEEIEVDQAVVNCFRRPIQEKSQILTAYRLLSWKTAHLS